MTLITGYSGLIHVLGCRCVTHIYKVVAPEIDDYDVGDFLEARRLDPCGTCLRSLVMKVRA